MDEDKQKYILEVRKRLEAFKTAKEWSDFISLLTALDTTLKRYKTSFIPERKMLFKRLNQCLNPALPAGVHNKVIQTYVFIFKKVDTETLINDFDILTLGLFSFSFYSKLSVKAEYFDLMENYILPLGQNVEHYSRNILLGLLPGLEEENNEFFSRTLKIIRKYELSISRRVFYASLWNCFLLIPYLRMAVINFLLKSGPYNSLLYDNEGLVVEALCAGLKDKEIFVLRGTLDVIITTFPLSSSCFKEESIIEITNAMFMLFLKRDITLNKRIYTWLNINADPTEQSIKIIIQSLTKLMNSRNVYDIHCFYKICTTLLDKGDVSDRVLEELTVAGIMRVYELSTENFENSRSNEEVIGSLEKSDKIDILKYVNIFIDMLDLSFLWRLLYNKLIECLSNNNSEKDNSDMPIEHYIIKEDINELHDNNVFILKPESMEIQKVDIIKEIKKYKKRREKRMLLKLSNPDVFLKMIEFAINNLNIKEKEVLNLHLPFFVFLVSINYDRFEFKNYVSFMCSCINRMQVPLLREELGCICTSSEDSCMKNKEIGDIIINFYKSGDITQLQKISERVFHTIINRITHLFGNQNFIITNSLFDSFISKHKITFKKTFVFKYFEYALGGDEDTLERGLEVLRKLDITYLDSKKVFRRLWNDLSLNGCKVLYKYNVFFHRKFEEHVVEAYLENEKDIDKVFKLLECVSKSHNTHFYFFNVFIILNNKISTNNLDFTYLANFINSFNDFMFLLKFFEILYVKKRFFSLINILNNFLKYSFKFKEFLLNIEEGKEEQPKAFIIKLLLASAMQGSENIVKVLDNSENIESSNIDDRINKEIKICDTTSNTILKSIELLVLLINENIISVLDLSIFPLNDFLSFLDTKEAIYSLLSLPIIGMLIDNRILHVSLIFNFLVNLVFKESFYFEFLNFIFEIKDVSLKRGILLRVFDRIYVKLKPHSSVYLSICTEIVTYILSKKGEFVLEDTSTIIKKCLEDSLLSTLTSALIFEKEESMFIDAALELSPTSDAVRMATVPIKIYTLILQRYNSRLGSKVYVYLENWNSYLDNFENILISCMPLIRQIFASKRHENIFAYIWLFSLLSKIDKRVLSTRELDLFYSCIDSSIILFQKISEKKNNNIVGLMEGLKKVLLVFDEYVSLLNAYMIILIKFIFLKDEIKNEKNNQKVELSYDTLLALPSKAYSREFFDYYLEFKVFNDSKKNMQKKLLILKNIDAEKIKLLFERMKPSIFTSKEAEHINRVQTIKKIAFMVLSGEVNQYSNYIPNLTEIISDFINSVTLKKEVLLLCRVVMMKSSHNKLTSLWPILFSEILNIFDNLLDGYSVNYAVVLEMMKNLDFMFLFNAPETLEFRWLFLDPYVTTKDTHEIEIKDTNAHYFNYEPLKVNEREDLPSDILEELNEHFNVYELNINLKNHTKCPQSPKLATKTSPKRECTKSYFKRLNIKLSKNKNEKEPIIIPSKRLPFLKLKEINSLEDMSFYIENAYVYYTLLDMCSSNVDATFLVDSVLDEFIEN